MLLRRRKPLLKERVNDGRFGSCVREFEITCYYALRSADETDDAS